MHFTNTGSRFLEKLCYSSLPACNASLFIKALVGDEFSRAVLLCSI